MIQLSPGPERLQVSCPFGPPYPDVYYGPRSAITGPPWVSLHAKCIVVGDELAFVTSANFTERGQTRNLAVGVSIEDRYFATLRRSSGGTWFHAGSKPMLVRVPACLRAAAGWVRERCWATRVVTVQDTATV